MDSVALASKEYYLRGNWRHWFWALLAIFLVSYAPGYIDKARWDDISIFLFVGFQCLLFSGGFAALYLVYGVKNKVKVYKVLFIILASLELPWMICMFLTNASVLDIFMMKNYNALFHMVVNNTTSYNYAFSIVNMSFFVIVACMKKANTLLRISAIVAAAVSLSPIVSSVIINSMVGEYLKTDELKAFSSFVLLIYYIRLGLHWSSLIFFFAAMSFSKMKINPVKEAEAKSNTV